VQQLLVGRRARVGHQADRAGADGAADVLAGHADGQVGAVDRGQRPPEAVAWLGVGLDEQAAAAPVMPAAEPNRMTTAPAPRVRTCPPPTPRRVSAKCGLVSLVMVG
jgi:hypothetical protein